MKNTKRTLCSLLILAALGTAVNSQDHGLFDADSKVEKLGEGYKFTEGPAWNGKDAVFFSDIPNNLIYKWTEKDGAKEFLQVEGATNGLYFDSDGNIIACQPYGPRAVIKIKPDGTQSVVCDTYQGKKLNSPNDLWIDPAGGIYFTDPRYGKQDDLQQGGFHVYYLAKGKKEPIRVIDDLVKPNGIIGSSDGKLLYVADPGDKKTYVYKIKEDGSVGDRKLAAPDGSDGVTLDEKGNLYITRQSVLVFNPKGEQIAEIKTPERPANVTFGGKDKQTLFITAQKGFYALKMKVKGQ